MGHRWKYNWEEIRTGKHGTNLTAEMTREQFLSTLAEWNRLSAYCPYNQWRYWE